MMDLESPMMDLGGPMMDLAGLTTDLLLEATPMENTNPSVEITLLPPGLQMRGEAMAHLVVLGEMTVETIEGTTGEMIALCVDQMSDPWHASMTRKLTTKINQSLRGS